MDQQIDHEIIEERLREKRVAIFLSLSLVLHAIFMGVFSHEWSEEKQAANVDLEVVPLSKEDIARIKNQVAETSKTQKSEKAAEDAYLGEQTQIVREQIRAETAAPFKDGRVGSAGAKGQDQAQAKPQPQMKLGDLGVKMNFKPLGGVAPGERAATSDHLKDVKPGAQTMLNTKEFVYFSFYQRVRKQLEQFWEPGLRERIAKLYSKGRTIASDQEHSTRLLVKLDSEGLITKIQVAGTSGLMDLDQAAIDAFNKAGPFPNPPKGMIERDGTVTIEWEFILKT